MHKALGCGHLRRLLSFGTLPQLDAAAAVLGAVRAVLGFSRCTLSWPLRLCNSLSSVAQSCLTVCDPHELQPARLLCLWEFSIQEYWSGMPCLPPGDLPNPGMEPRSPTLEADSLSSEPPGKPMLKPSLQGFKHDLTSMGMSEIVQWLAHSLVLPFLGTGMRVDFFQSCGHCWVFQIC